VNLARFFHAARLGPLAAFVLPVLLGAMPLSATAGDRESDSRVMEPRGRWTLGLDPDGKRVWVGFEMRSSDSRHEHSYGRDLDLATVQGLDPRMLHEGSGDVDFEIHRGAGTLHCKGALSKGEGGGFFEAELDRGFADRLARRGVGRPDESQQLRLLMADADEALLDLLAEQQYPRPDLDTFIRFAEHGVDRSFVRSLGEHGYRLGSLADLLQARDHGVDAHFIDGMAQAGYRNQEFASLLLARDHGADPDYAADMSAAGYGHLPLEALIQARDHGVDAMYAEQMTKAGFPDLSLQSLIRARDHGVSPMSARRMRERHSDLTLDEVIERHDRGERD
jgi:hypothetical protein